MLTIAMQKLLPEDVNDCLHVLTILYRQNLADNASYVAPPLDGNGTQLIVETKSPTTKNNKAFPMLCELALLGFDFYGKRSTWTTAHPKGDQPLLYYSADSKTPANELRDYIVERGKGLWAFQPELAETLPAKRFICIIRSDLSGAGKPDR